MTTVLDWIKSNIVTVVFLVVMVAALVALPILAGRLNADVKEDVVARVGQFGELDRLERTSVELPSPGGGPPVNQNVIINPQFLRQYNQYTEAQRADAEQILTLAADHNRKDRTVLLAELFPEPPAAQAEVLPKIFHETLIEAHEALLRQINAGSPPSSSEMIERIRQQQARFYTQKLQKDIDDPLDEQEQALLKAELTKERMTRYLRAADAIKLYVSADDLNLPTWDQTYLPIMAELFEWQWQYWINQDLLEALADANAESSSVLSAPVKRVLDITIWGYEPPAPTGVPGAATPAGAVGPDYTATFTGRTTNALYDVRDVQLTAIVDTNRLPEVLDALARRNFITVLDLTMEPVDPFDSAHEGFLYGGNPVSKITMRLEMIWLRSWTTQFMPVQVKENLGIPTAPPGGTA